MKKVLKDISFQGIVQSGEIYVFTEREDRSCQMEGFDITYTIRSDEELKEALEMEIELATPQEYSIEKSKKSLRWKKLSDNCYQFDFSNPKAGFPRGETHTLYLHRMPRFRERFEYVELNYK